jgi:hypothetical protein
MKNLYTILTFLSLLVAVNATKAQVTLTMSQNGMVPGDNSILREIDWFEPGNPGENLIWDLSQIRFTGKSLDFRVSGDTANIVKDPYIAAVILGEDGTDYTYSTDASMNLETGYENTSRKMKLVYDDPLIRMKFPFSYGQQFTDTFGGTAWYNQVSRVDLGGTLTVTGDAFGTLILPDRILRNVLRVTTVSRSLQVNVCGSNQCTVEKHFWYAPGYRYPVVIAGVTTNRYGMKEPVVVKTCRVNLDQVQAGAAAAGTGKGTVSEADDNAVIVYPNPFSEQLTYSYFLREQIPVSVDLYDLSGKITLRVESKQLRDGGLHTGNVNAALNGLAPGVYYLRFTFDREMTVTKVVKI